MKILHYNAAKTHCPAGHPYDSANTYVRPSDGARLCRLCLRTNQRAWDRANRLKRRSYEGSPKELVRRAAAKRRLRQDPAWQAREHENSRRRRRRPEVKAKNAAVVSRWKVRNRERVRFLNARRRARGAAAMGAAYCTQAKLAARAAFFGGRCVYCGGSFEAMDHVIPLERGGADFPSNQVPSCSSCNSSKGTKPLAEWSAAA